MSSTHAQTMSGVTSQHCTWTTNIERRRRVWYVIIALGQQARLHDVERSMIAWSLRNTHGRSTPIFVCQHFHLTTTTIELCQASHAIIDLGQHTRSNDVEHGMPSSTFDNTHGHTTSGEVCHHRPWTAHTVKQHQAWHAHMGLR